MISLNLDINVGDVAQPGFRVLGEPLDGRLLIVQPQRGRKRSGQRGDVALAPDLVPVPPDVALA